MKKILIGCGITFIVLILIIGGFVIWGVQAARKMGAQMEQAGTRIADTNTAFPFNPPADGKLTEPQLATWIKVREQFTARDGKRLAEVHGAWERMRMMMNFPENITAYAAILKESKMSAAEYGWITEQVFGALKSRAAEKDPQTKELAALIEQPDPTVKQFNDQQRGRFNYTRFQVAPLAVEDAQPILALIKKHEAAFRKVAYQSMADGILQGQGRIGRRIARYENRPTSGTQAEEKKTTATTAEKPAAPPREQDQRTTATR